MTLSPDEVAEKEAWDDLLRCPGWQRLETVVRDHRQRELESQLEMATNVESDLTALRRIQAIAASRRAIEQLLAYPRDRLKALTAKQQVARGDLAGAGYTRGGI